jgi:hypothetical protein
VSISILGFPKQKGRNTVGMHTFDGQVSTKNREPEALKEHKSHRYSNSCFKGVHCNDAVIQILFSSNGAL